MTGPLAGTMTSTVRRVAVFIGILFVALIVNLNVIQVGQANQYRNDNRNSRTIIEEYDHERGPILVVTNPVARSVATKDRLKYLRTYDGGPSYAPSTGFYSIVYGRTGIERAENDILTGKDARLFTRSVQDLLTGKEKRGGAVQLTINPAAQKAAYDGLTSKGLKGAVVALEPSTGRILAIASSPSFDPNALSAHDTNAVRAAYEKLNSDPNQPMLNRPLARTYAPGSVFKVVTTAAALSSGKYTPDTVIPAPASIPLPGTSITLSNLGNRPCKGGSVTLTEALEVSCNTAFAQVGMAVGDDALRAQAEKFGFGSTFQVPMTAATSVFPPNLNQAQTAQAAIGQFDVRTTALQMAMVAAAVANQGVVMSPYLVDQLLAPDLSVLERSQPKEFGRAVTPDIAKQITDMMVNVVDNGTGKPGQIPGVKVAGKTGTAQTSPGKPPNAWFISFADANDAKVAVAVVIEGGGDPGDEVTGGRLAAPVAKAVMEAVLR